MPPPCKGVSCVRSQKQRIASFSCSVILGCSHFGSRTQGSHFKSGPKVSHEPQWQDVVMDESGQLTSTGAAGDQQGLRPLILEIDSSS
eukprot:1896306-Amphidinium_carterae.1